MRVSVGNMAKDGELVQADLVGLGTPEAAVMSEATTSVASIARSVTSTLSSFQQNLLPIVVALDSPDPGKVF
jgi:hypothetical protein